MEQPALCVYKGKILPPATGSQVFPIYRSADEQVGESRKDKSSQGITALGGAGPAPRPRSRDSSHQHRLPSQQAASFFKAFLILAAFLAILVFVF